MKIGDKVRYIKVDTEAILDIGEVYTIVPMYEFDYERFNESDFAVKNEDMIFSQIALKECFELVTKKGE